MCALGLFQSRTEGMLNRWQLRRHSRRASWKMHRGTNRPGGIFIRRRVAAETVSNHGEALEAGTDDHITGRVDLAMLCRAASQPRRQDRRSKFVYWYRVFIRVRSSSFLQEINGLITEASRIAPLLIGIGCYLSPLGLLRPAHKSYPNASVKGLILLQDDR